MGRGGAEALAGGAEDAEPCGAAVAATDAGVSGAGAEAGGATNVGLGGDTEADGDVPGGGVSFEPVISTIAITIATTQRAPTA